MRLSSAGTTHPRRGMVAGMANYIGNPSNLLNQLRRRNLTQEPAPAPLPSPHADSVRELCLVIDDLKRDNRRLELALRMARAQAG